MEEPLTDVIFRVWKNEPKDVLALFPGIAAKVGLPEYCLSYEHAGQHGAAAPRGCMHLTRPAKPEEYADLFDELRGRGYRLNVVRRLTAGHYAERTKQLRRA